MRTEKKSLTTLIAGSVLLAIVVVLLRDALFAREHVFLGSARADMYHLFIQWMDFGFGWLREGSLALWNPYNFSGAPFFGSFQAALLYPLNVFLYTILPLHLAVNWSIALHIFMLGFFVYLWLDYRGMRPLSSGSAAVICMLSGTFYFRLCAGHLSVLTTAAWAPLLLLSIDGIDRDLRLKWVFTGILAAAMMGLAGHPQYFFYVSLASFFYFALILAKSKNRLRKLFAAAAIPAGGAMLSAVQLFTSFSESSESIRSGGMSYEFASSFALPPESLITLLVPRFFGDPVNLTHWGRSFAWEASVFMGVAGFLLMVYGAVFGKVRHKKIAAAAALFAFIMALGSYTPLFPFFYRHAPGFNVLRGTAKLMFPASLFMALLMGAGFEAFYKARGLRAMAYISCSIAAVLFMSAVSLQSSVELGSDFWPGVMRHVYRAGPTYAAPGTFADGARMAEAGMFAVKGLKMSALFSLLFAVILSLRKKRFIFVYALAALVVLEMFVFAKSITSAFSPEALYRQNRKISAFLEEHPGDYRIMSTSLRNNSAMISAFDIWGDHLSMLRRYAEFMNFARGDDDPFRKSDDAMMGYNFSGYNNFLRVLRLRYVFRGGEVIRDFGESLPRAYAVSEWDVISDREALLSALKNETFEPAGKVLLESEPFEGDAPGKTGGNADCGFEFAPLPGGGLSVRGRAGDYIVLVITDSYSRNWKIIPAGDGRVQEYRVMPAFYAVMGVPLKPGEHDFKLEYMPSGFIIGKWVSIISVMAYIVCAVFIWRRNGQPKIERK